jgi:predicted transcriptional regulator
MNLTPTEYNVLKALGSKRWKTTAQIAAAIGTDHFAVAQALFYLSIAGKVERKPWLDGLSKWRKA